VGTTFELRVPLTLALVTVLVVRARGHAYALDASHVIETAALDPAAVTRDTDADAGSTGSYSALWHGQRLPLVSLRALVEGGATRPPGGATGERLFVCIVRRERDESDAWQNEDAPDRFVIAVDKIEGEREALVRTLGRHATRWRGVSGAFEQRDGTVALLLDLPRLL
jgi:two-component system chemotaxis sensor kinase CheA/two-component system sensor histidine kinase and response regulator WspE